MINFTCAQCGQAMSVPDEMAGQSGKCKQCGAPVRVPGINTAEAFQPDQTPPISSEQKQSPWKQNINPIGCLVMIGILLFFGYTCSRILTPSEETKQKIQEEKKWGSPTMAYQMSQEFVKQRLKSPGSADFPFLDFTATQTKNKGEFLVKGYCDAQNAFGAKIRVDYTCTMKCQNERWSCTNLKINER